MHLCDTHGSLVNESRAGAGAAGALPSISLRLILVAALVSSASAVDDALRFNGGEVEVSPITTGLCTAAIRPSEIRRCDEVVDNAVIPLPGTSQAGLQPVGVKLLLLASTNAWRTLTGVEVICCGAMGGAASLRREAELINAPLAASLAIPAPITGLGGAEEASSSSIAIALSFGAAACCC